MALLPPPCFKSAPDTHAELEVPDVRAAEMSREPPLAPVKPEMENSGTRRVSEAGRRDPDGGDPGSKALRRLPGTQREESHSGVAFPDVRTGRVCAGGIHRVGIHFSAALINTKKSR